MEQPDNNAEVTISASHEDYQAFLNSLVWQDLRTELTVQKEIAAEALAVSDDPKDIYRLQGKLEACKDFLSMPSDFIKLIEDRFSTTSGQSTDSDGTMLLDLDYDSTPTDSDSYYNQLLDNFKERE